MRFLDHTHRRPIVGRTLLDEVSSEYDSCLTSFPISVRPTLTVRGAARTHLRLTILDNKSLFGSSYHLTKFGHGILLFILPQTKRKGHYVKVEIEGGNTVYETVLLSVLEIQADYRILTSNSSQELSFMSILTHSLPAI